MNIKLYTLLFAATSILTFSCKTASKLYEKGSYTEAVEIAAKKIQKKPNDAKLLEIIQTSYRLAITDHESRIRSNAENNNELKWEWMYNEYAAMQKMYESIFRIPTVFTRIEPKDYSSYLITYADKAADVRMKRGIEFMQRYDGQHHSDKQSYRNAYREFQTALHFKPGNTEAITKMNEAYNYAVTNIVILPLQQQGGFAYSNYPTGMNYLDDELIRNLQYNSGNEFVRFYNVWDARSRNIRIDQELDMRLASVDIGRYFDNRSSRRVTKDIVVKEIVYRPDSVVREYATVYADITSIHRTISSHAMMQVSIRDENGRWIWSDNVAGNHNWATEFATYTGDARALSESDKQVINRSQVYGPSENEIMRYMLEQLSNNVIYTIKNYFNRY